ncbi:hypothetical protein BJ165DRAFT_1407126 [Panaeolus papilionaceus]|nr:hypothetical protein BJ165DRAFT_1407126 [Panaeolus papilionaceus]
MTPALQDERPALASKRKADDKTADTPKAEPEDVKLSSSLPTQPPAKKTKLSEFAVLAEAEEATRQAELAVEQAKVEALAKLKIEQRRQRSLDKKAMLDHELAKMRLKMEFKLHMKQASSQAQHLPFESSSTIGMPHDSDLGDNFRDDNFGNIFQSHPNDYSTLHLPSTSANNSEPQGH